MQQVNIRCDRDKKFMTVRFVKSEQYEKQLCEYCYFNEVDDTENMILLSFIAIFICIMMYSVVVLLGLNWIYWVICTYWLCCVFFATSKCNRNLFLLVNC